MPGRPVLGDNTSILRSFCRFTKTHKEHNRMARPELYHDETEFIIHTTGDSRLHANSDRRAIVDLIVENGGRMKLGAIDEHFGYSVRDRVLALKRCGWLALAPEPEPPVKKPPERPAKKKKSKKQTGAKKR